MTVSVLHSCHPFLPKGKDCAEKMAAKDKTWGFDFSYSKSSVDVFNIFQLTCLQTSLKLSISQLL